MSPPSYIMCFWMWGKSIWNFQSNGKNWWKGDVCWWKHMLFVSGFVDVTLHWFSEKWLIPGHTVDGRNPAPVDRYFIPLFTRFFTSQVVGNGISSINRTRRLDGWTSVTPHLSVDQTQVWHLWWEASGSSFRRGAVGSLAVFHNFHRWMLDT